MSKLSEPPARPSKPPSITGTLRSASSAGAPPAAPHPCPTRIVAPHRPETGGVDLSPGGPRSDGSGPPSSRPPVESAVAASQSVEDPSGARPSARPGPRSDSLAPPQASRTFTGPMVRPTPPAWRPDRGGRPGVDHRRRHRGGASSPEAPRAPLPPGRSPRRGGRLPQAPPTAVAIAVSPTAEPPRGPDVRILRIESQPPGAVVSDQGVQVCMHTPCDVYWPGKVAHPGTGSRWRSAASSPPSSSSPPPTRRPPSSSKPGASARSPPSPRLRPAALRARRQRRAALAARPLGPPSPARPPSPTSRTRRRHPAPPSLPWRTPCRAPTPVSRARGSRRHLPPVATAPPAAPAPTGGPMHVEDVDTRPKARLVRRPHLARAEGARGQGLRHRRRQVQPSPASGALSGCRIIKGVPFMDGPVLASLATLQVHMRRWPRASRGGGGDAHHPEAHGAVAEGAQPCGRAGCSGPPAGRVFDVAGRLEQNASPSSWKPSLLPASRGGYRAPRSSSPASIPEELNIPELTARLLRTFDVGGFAGEVVLVDDGSTDGTPPRHLAPRWRRTRGRWWACSWTPEATRASPGRGGRAARAPPRASSSPPIDAATSSTSPRTCSASRRELG